MVSGEESASVSSYTFLWDLDAMLVLQENTYKGTGDRHSLIHQICSECAYVLGSVVGIRDGEGNQTFQGFAVMELTFHEDKTGNERFNKEMRISDGGEVLGENETGDGTKCLDGGWEN